MHMSVDDSGGVILCVAHIDKNTHTTFLISLLEAGLLWNRASGTNFLIQSFSRLTYLK